MICPNCKQENYNGSKFCNHCGAPLPAPQPAPAAPQKESNLSTMILLIWGGATIFMYFVIELYIRMGLAYSSGIGRFIYLVMILFRIALVVLPAFAIPNKKLKIIGAAVMGTYAMFCIIYQIYSFFYLGYYY